MTRITCEENQWRTTCEYSLQVSEGLLDAIELDVPASWKESVKTSPAMAATFAASSDERASLVLSPSAAISGDATFTLTGPPVAATRFAVPNVALKHVESVKKYVVLPNSADHRPVAWALQNLRRCDAKEPAPDDTVKYEVVGEPWQAVLLPPQKTTATTRVVQADVRYAWQADGRCLGAAFLDVETAGAIDCPLELPEGFELLQLSVDGLPVDAVRRQRRRRGTWTVPLASQASVSRVELLFFAESAMPRPRPAGPGGARSARRSWAICRSSARSGPSPRPARCKRRLPTAARIQRRRPLPATPRPATLPHSGSGSSQKAGRPFPTPPAAGRCDRRWTIGPWKPSHGSRGWRASRGSWSVVGLAALLIRRGLLWNWFARWPYLFGVGIGLAWWLWLSPSAVGLLIVLAVSAAVPSLAKVRARPAVRTHHAPRDVVSPVDLRARTQRLPRRSQEPARQRAGLHRLHDLGPADFDRADAQAQLVGDLAVRLAFEQQVEHVAKRRRELLQAAANRLHVGDLLPLGGVPAEGLVDGGPQALVAARFQQKIECPRFIASTAVSTSAAAAMPITGQ